MENLRQFFSNCLACIPGFGFAGEKPQAPGQAAGEPAGLMEMRASRKVGTSDMKIPDAGKGTPDYSVYAVEKQSESKKYPRLSKPNKGQLILVKGADDRDEKTHKGIFPSLPKGPTSLVSSKKQGYSPAVSRAVSAMQSALDRFRSEDDSPVTQCVSAYQREGAMSTLLGVQNWEDVIERMAAPPRDAPATSTPCPTRVLSPSYALAAFPTGENASSSSQIGDRARSPTPDLGIAGIGYASTSRQQADKKYVLENWFNKGMAKDNETSEGKRLPRNAAPFLIDDPVSWEVDFGESSNEAAHRRRQERKQRKIQKLREKLKRSKNTADLPDERLRSNGAKSAVMWEIDFAEKREWPACLLDLLT
ncbi:uncharacterized protein LOC116620027 isoform X2 [Nematostella vectensis]|uniref:uncharacterized protein LOC116620027 isoform X2 n=1 Tax=Nematostella vectensis TaxID=45351 RepID=UPI0020770351|nr:uncharacterized protein LOC116620027 isoform X2 [Nematostella vectensis]